MEQGAKAVSGNAKDRHWLAEMPFGSPQLSGQGGLVLGFPIATAALPVHCRVSARAGQPSS